MEVNLDSRRETPMTSRPRSVRRRAISRPSPLLAPVTMATSVMAAILRFTPRGGLFVTNHPLRALRRVYRALRRYGHESKTDPHPAPAHHRHPARGPAH